MNISGNKLNKIFSVTGAFHGSIVEAKNEGEARQLFHKKYNGESIIEIKLKKCNHLHGFYTTTHNNIKRCNICNKIIK